MQFEAKCNVYVKRDVPRMLVKTFSAAWLSSRNSLRFLGIVIVYPGDSGPRIPLWAERRGLSARLFGARTKFPNLITQTRQAGLSLETILSTGRFSPHQSVREMKYAHPSCVKTFSFRLLFSNANANLPESSLHPESRYLETLPLICYVCFFAYLFANAI